MTSSAGWYHNWEPHNICEIDYFSDTPNMDFVCNGPFKTFAEAKADALDKARWEYETARDMLRETRALRKPGRK